MTPEEARDYQAAIKAQEAQLIRAETVGKSIGWLKQLEKDYPNDGLDQFSDYLGENRKTRHLKKTLATTYRTFSSLSPKERETWKCMPTTYQNIKRLNDTAREYYQELKKQEKRSHSEEHYQQLCLDLMMEDPSR